MKARSTVSLMSLLLLSAVFPACSSTPRSGQLEVVSPLRIVSGQSPSNEEVTLPPGNYAANVLLVKDDCMAFEVDGAEVLSFTVSLEGDLYSFPLLGGNIVAPPVSHNQSFAMQGEYVLETRRRVVRRGTAGRVLPPCNSSGCPRNYQPFDASGLVSESYEEIIESIDLELRDPDSSVVLATFSGRNPVDVPRSQAVFDQCD